MARNISGRKGAGRKAGSSAGDGGSSFRPTRDDILAYIRDNPDRAGKREIAKAFSLKAGDRIWLKDVLRELQDEGLLRKERKRLSAPGTLPHVAVLDIFGRDPDGGLLARPAERLDEDDAQNPVVSIHVPRGQKGPIPGIGDRVLARASPSREEDGPGYVGRVLKVLDRRLEAVLGVLRVAHDGAFHIEPVERHRRRLDRVGVADIDAAIAEPRKIGPIVRGVIGRLRACPPDMDRRAARAKAMGDAVADPARSANHQHRLSGEVGIVLHADPRRHAGSPDRPRRLAPHPVPAARADQGARPSAARRDR